MRLDLHTLAVQSFATGPSVPITITHPVDTGKGGPDSLCWICYETGNTVPSCDIRYCPQVETVDFPCTQFPPCTVA